MTFYSYLTPHQNFYNINHDLIVSLVNPENRQKAITTFIAFNTPRKLDPKDRNDIHSIKKDIGRKSLLGGIVGALASEVIIRMQAPKIYSIPISIVAFYAMYNVTRIEIEKHVMFHNSHIAKLSHKYNFSIYDFHNSKKESQLEGIISNYGQVIEDK